MRKLPLSRFVLSCAALIGGVFVWVACGDDDSTPGISPSTPDAASPDSSTSGEVDSGTGEETDSGGEKDTGTPVEKDPNDRWDAGERTTLDGGTGIEGGVPCILGGELEDDPNNTKPNANELNPTAYTRCGEVGKAPLLSDAGDVDWLKFGIDAGSTEFYIQYDGNVGVFVEWGDGGPVDITQKPSPNVPLRPGEQYYAKVQSKDGQTHKYRVTVFQCAGASCPPK
jgi:hypothetical protein